MLNVRIDKDMKKKLKLISIYEEVTVTDLVTGFISYGLKIYEDEQRLINNK